METLAYTQFMKNDVPWIWLLEMMIMLTMDIFSHSLGFAPRQFGSGV